MPTLLRRTNSEQMKTIIYIHLVSAFSIILPFAAGVYATFKLRKNELFLFSVYQAFMFFSQFLMLYVIFFGIIKNNLFVIHLFAPYEFLLLTYILIEWIGEKELWLLFGLPVIAVFIIQFSTNFRSWQTSALIIESVPLAILSIISLYYLIRHDIKNMDKILIVVGLVAYFGTQSIIGLVYNRSDLIAPQTIAVVVNFTSNIIYTIALVNNAR